MGNEVRTAKRFTRRQVLAGHGKQAGPEPARAAGEAPAKAALGARGRLGEIVVGDAAAAQIDLGDQPAVGRYSERAVASAVEGEPWI